MEATGRNQEAIDDACLERDLASYEAVGVLRTLKATGLLPARSYGHEVLKRYDEAKARIEKTSGVRQEEPEVRA